MSRVLFAAFFLTCTLFVLMVSQPIIALSNQVQFNIYDLAEWVSLVPSERNRDIPLLLPMILRLQFTFSLCLIVFFSKKRSVLAMVWLATLGLLPPLELLTQLGDSNYQQQVVIFASTLVLTVISYQIKRPEWVYLLSVMGLIGLFWGVQESLSILETYQLGASHTLNLALVALLYTVISLLQFGYYNKNGVNYHPIAVS